MFAEIVPCQVSSHMLVELGFTKSLYILIFANPLTPSLKPVSMTQILIDLCVLLAEAGNSMTAFSWSILSNHSSDETFLSLIDVTLPAFLFHLLRTPSFTDLNTCGPPKLRGWSGLQFLSREINFFQLVCWTTGVLTPSSL